MGIKSLGGTPPSLEPKDIITLDTGAYKGVKTLFVRRFGDKKGAKMCLF